MKRRLLYAIPLLAAIALAAGLGGYMAGQNQTADHAMRVEVYVYKNGELVYHDPDDPATDNFINIIYSIASGPQTMTKTDGTTFSGVDTLRYGSRVAVSNGAITAFTREMYALPGTVWYSASPLTIQKNSNELIMSGTVTVDTATNITWVGLEFLTDPGTTVDTTTGYWILVFADPLDQPIHVQQGDVITVVYKIVFP